MMAALRANPPKKVAHLPVERVDDYLLAKEASDVLHFWLQGGGKVVIRPSGTEPKIKIYSEVCDPSATPIARRISSCDELLAAFKKDFDLWLTVQ